MEDLTKDILDADFIEIFRWMHYFQNIMGYSRVTIKDRFVTPPQKVYIIYSFVMWIIIVPVSSFYFIMTTVMVKYDLLSFIHSSYFIYLSGMGACIASYFAYCNHFDKRDLNCQVYVKLQKIDRLLGAEFVKMNRFLAIVSKIFLVLIFAGTSIWLYFISYIYCTEGYFLITVFMHVAPLAYSAEALLFILILKYLNDRMEYVVNELKELRSHFKSEDLIESVSRSHSLYETGDLRLRLQKTERVVRGIHAVLSSMLDVEEVFRHSIFCGMGLLLLLSHFIFLLTIGYFRMGKIDLKLGLGIMVVLPPYIFSFIAMAVYGYRLSEMLKQTKRLCSAIISCSSADEETVRNANRILILLDAKSPTISIYGLFKIDQTLPLRVLSVVTSYTYLYMQYVNLF